MGLEKAEHHWALKSGVMSCWDKAHERRDAEAKHLTEQRDAESDKARHMREQEQRDTLRQRKSGVMLRYSTPVHK